jgi:hypothetical protein
MPPSVASSNPYQGLNFSVGAVRTEVSYVNNLCRDFLKPQCHHIIDGWPGGLNSFGQQAVGARWNWRVLQDSPLLTRDTREYESEGREGGHIVWGELSFIWELTLVKRSPKAAFCLDGNASCKLRIQRKIEERAPESLAQWQFEVGAKDSPGCHFHVGITGEDDTVPFPHWLPVPRLPGLLFLPTDAIDFLLGELFQASWRKHVSADTNDSRGLGNLQGHRFERLLRWNVTGLESGFGSAWNRLKHRKPPVGLFLPEGFEC